MRHDPPRSTRRRLRVIAGVLALATVASACGGTKASDGGATGTGNDTSGLDSSAGETPAPTGEPVRGGTLSYAIESDSPEGYCLPEAQLAMSGMMISRAFYDTLTMPNNAGGYSPYLAKSVTSNEDATEWTIGLREGVTFSDGSDLDATVLKNNLDAYRGTYPARSPLLFTFVLNNIADTEIVDPLTVKVTMKSPWVSFPAFLYSSSRLGIVGQAQLDDTETCASKLIGTGPFTFESWEKKISIKGVRNADYWQTAPDGKPYPYADAIDFQFKPDGQIRANALRSHGVNVLLSSDASLISTTFKDLVEAGKNNMYVSQDATEVSFLQMNTTAAPFDDLTFRKAMATGTDREDINEVINNGFPTIADGPFAKDSIGYVENPGYPEYDLAEAKKLVKEYEASGGTAAFTLFIGVDPASRRLGEVLQESAAQFGVKVSLNTADGPTIINAAIGKKYQAMAFRNFPGGDPDINHIWWYGKGNPVNFSGYDDPIINDLLDKGRAEFDPEVRAKIYQDINRRFAEQVYSLWSWFTPWAIVEDKSVHNVLGPPLPGADPSKPGKTSTSDPELQPSTGIATGHSLLGMWIDQ